MSSGSMRCDKGLVKAREDFVDHFVAVMFQHGDFGGGAGQPRISRSDAVQQQSRSFRDDLHLF